LSQDAIHQLSAFSFEQITAEAQQVANFQMPEAIAPWRIVNFGGR
jgi:hypothetical protein